MFLEADRDVDVRGDLVVGRVVGEGAAAEGSSANTTRAPRSRVSALAAVCTAFYAKDFSGGIPAHGNQRSEWDAGCR